MAHTPDEAKAYMDACHYALQHSYDMLTQVSHDREALQQHIQALQQRYDALLAQHFLVISTQDWLAREGLYRPDPNVENLIAKFQSAPLQGMAHELEALADPRRIEEQRRQALARIGATEQSVAAIAGLVLQIAKDVLAFRFGEKPSALPNVRMIGSQPIVNVIWEGRNHAMHWDDPNPHQPVRALLQTLHQELQVPIVAHQNNSLAILDVLGWTDTHPVVRDLQTVVALG